MRSIKKPLFVVCEAFLILCLSLLLGFLLNFTFISDVVSGKKDFLLREDTEVSNLAPIINLKQAKEIFNNRAAVFLDARSEEQYTRGHIPGALNLPINDFNEKYSSIIENIPREMTIVTYCSGSGCDSSVFLANNLVELGYMNIIIFYGGWPEWVKAGYPVAVGE